MNQQYFINYLLFLYLTLVPIMGFATTIEDTGTLAKTILEKTDEIRFPEKIFKSKSILKRFLQENTGRVQISRVI